ncbi:hypothetical protein TcYC6_0099810 [Trypanosoma cruzi]|nr:hypothetical protein TcYC6_0099810 [Trypanosoma cruzi]
MQKLLIAINGTTTLRPSALSNARHKSPPPLPREVGMRPMQQRGLGDPAWKGEPHDAPGEVELLLGLRGAQGLMRGIRGWQGFARRIAVAPFGGVLECMLDATPGHSSWMRLWSLFRRRLRQTPACRQRWEERGALGVRHSRGIDVHGISPVGRATAYTQSHGSSGQRKRILERGSGKFRALSKRPETGPPFPPGSSESKQRACRTPAQ